MNDQRRERITLVRRLIFEPLRRILSHPAADRVLPWLGFLLLLPSLDTGLAADDYLFTVMLDRPAPIAGFERFALDLFRFCDPRFTPSLIDEGVLMWWDDPNARLAFMRPLTSLTHLIDHTLWRNVGWPMHLHSALWALFLYSGVRALYRELIPERFVATLALALYVLDDARGWFVSWVAARNAVIGTALSVWVLVLHMRGRRGQMGSAAAPVLFGFALLGSEGAIATLGYILGHALFLEEGRLRERLVRLWPYVVVVVVWRVFYRALDYGVVGSSLYVDPSRDPLRFISTFAENAPILLGSQLGAMWSDTWIPLFFAPLARAVIFAATIVLIGLVASALVRPLRENPVLRCFGFGALVSLVPASATFSSDRLLSWVAIGMAPLLAALIAPVLIGPARGAPWWKRGVAGWLIVSHLVVGVLFLPSRARGTLVIRNFIDRTDAGIPRDPSIRDKTLVFVNPPHVPFSAYVPIERAARGVPRARLQRTLATSTTDLVMTRVDSHTLRLRPLAGFIPDPTSRLVWSQRRPYAVGDRVRLTGMEIVVRAITADRRPLEVDARFDRPLEHPDFVWRQWVGTGPVPFTPPPPGTQVVLPGVEYARALLGIELPIELLY